MAIVSRHQVHCLKFLLCSPLVSPLQKNQSPFLPSPTKVHSNLSSPSHKKANLENYQKHTLIMSSPHTIQSPTTQEIETSFIQVLSNGPLSLEAITDHMTELVPGHEDAVVAVFEYMVEAIEGEGESTYQLRPEYLPTSSSSKQATPTRKTPPAPLSFARSPARSPQPSSSPLSSPPTHLSSPASSLPPRPRPRYTSSSPLSSPPPTCELRSPIPPPPSPAARPVRRTQRAGQKGKGKAKTTTTTSSRVTKKKTGKGKGKKGGMEKVQCSGVTKKKKKTRCGLRKMCEVGQVWDCGRHG